MVFRSITDNRYQSEISGAGQVVKINEIGDITVNDYSENVDITFETLSDAQKELVIDQKKYFAFTVDDVARAQSNIEVMQGAMSKASFAIRDVVDQFIAGKYDEAGIPTSNVSLGSSGSAQDVHATGDGGGGDDTILGVISNIHQAMDENNVPSEDRWVAWSPVFHAQLKFAGIVDNLAVGIKELPDGTFGNGFIGNLLGLNMYASNNVSKASSSEHRIMFGTTDAIAFASQVDRIENVRLEKRFADGVKGLFVYGGKVVRPDNLGVAYLNPVGKIST